MKSNSQTLRISVEVAGEGENPMGDREKVERWKEERQREKKTLNLSHLTILFLSLGK